MLFLGVLLFVILSSGSLQCALNCYDGASQNRPGTALVADCHPLAIAQLTQSPASDFCHYDHSQGNVDREPALQSIHGGQYLALFSSRCGAPAYRSAEPIIQAFAHLTSYSFTDTEFLPLSQNLKQLRSTILLM